MAGKDHEMVQVSDIEDLELIKFAEFLSGRDHKLNDGGAICIYTGKNQTYDNKRLDHDIVHALKILDYPGLSLLRVCRS